MIKVLKQRVFVVSALLVVLFLGVSFIQSTNWVVEPSVVVNPSGRAPLSVLVQAKTDKNTKLVIEVREGKDRRVIVSKRRGKEHSVPVLDLKPGREYEVNVKVSRIGGSVRSSKKIGFVTEALPSDFPRLEVKVLKPEKMEDGVTLFNVMRWRARGWDSDYGLIVGVNRSGDVVWYYMDKEGPIEEVQTLENGNIAFLRLFGGAVEINKLGDVVKEWSPKNVESEVEREVTQVDVDSFHHELNKLRNGNFIVLSADLRQVDGFPEKRKVIDDVVVEFDEEGKVRNRWSLIDILDPFRLSYGSMDPMWGQLTYNRGDTSDWGHSNSVQYVEEDESFIVSLRHQDAVVKFDRQGKLKWILGDPYGWREPWASFLLKPIGDTQWSYHQHAAEIILNGNLLLYDNGNARAISPLPPLPVEQAYSRAVEYKINEENMTVEQVWSYGGEGSESFYSPFISDADALEETGNILITDGGRINDGRGMRSDDVFGGGHWARLVEVTKNSVPEKVFELIVGNPEVRAGGGGWAVYRSERVKDFFD